MARGSWGMPVDSVGQVINDNGKPWHGDATLRERLIGHSYAGPASSMGGHTGGMLLDSVGRVNDDVSMQPTGWHGDAPLRERVTAAILNLHPLGLMSHHRWKALWDC